MIIKSFTKKTLKILQTLIFFYSEGSIQVHGEVWEERRILSLQIGRRCVGKKRRQV